MIERQKRLHEVYEYLRENSGIHTQIDFAEALKYSRVYISAAMNGKKKNLTDKLFAHICETFPVTFNLQYLLTGEGELLQQKESVPEPDTHADNMLELYARMIRGVDDLRLELRNELEALQQAREDFRLATARLTHALAELRDTSHSAGLLAAESPQENP
jgi:transcriptional regulator with XRE-family HTH domain